MISISLILLYNIISFCSGSPTPQMTITFENDADLLLWTFVKLLVTYKQCQYLFATQCIRWILASVQLYPALGYYLEYQKFASEESNSSELWQLWGELADRNISSTPQDIQRQSESAELAGSVGNQYQADPLRRTRNGRINHLPKPKQQLKAKRKRLAKLQNKNCIWSWLPFTK